MPTPIYLSKILKDQIDPIVTNNKQSVYYLEARFFNKLDSSWQVVVGRGIKSLAIQQDFITSYSDKVMLECSLTPYEYMLIQRSQIELHCSLSFAPAVISPTVDVDYSSKRVKEYIAIPMSNYNISKDLSESSVLREPDSVTKSNTTGARIVLTFELIDEELFMLRKVKTSFILQHANILSVMRFAAEQMGVKKTAIVQPDNIKEYNRFVVPPMTGFKELFNYFQHGDDCGVYERGYNYYFTDGVLYVYPRFGNSEKKLGELHLYNVGKDMYGGLRCYHLDKEDGSVHVLLNQGVENYEYSSLGSENDLTAAGWLDRSRVLNGYFTMNADGTVTVAEDNVKTEHWYGNSGAKDGVFNLQWFSDNYNVYDLRSKLIRMQGTSMITSWHLAKLFSIVPHQLVNFHYDESSTYKVINCKCEQVQYLSTKVESNVYPLFTFSAVINLATVI